MNKPTEDSIVNDLATAVSDVTYTCSRSWEAWGYRTMTEDDFTDASQDEEWLYSTVEVVKDSLQPILKDADEMDLLSDGDIVTCDGKAFVRVGNRWSPVGGQDKYLSSDGLLENGEVRVIHFAN